MIDGSRMETAEETIDTLLDVHFSKYEKCGIEEDTLSHNQICDSIFTENIMRWAICTFDPYKSTGPSSIFLANI